MKKLTVVLLIAAVVVGSLLAQAEQEAATEVKPILIGLSDAFSGAKASNGDYTKEGATMFLEHINAKGGVLGRPVEIVYVDDQGNETMATNAYQKLILENEVCATVLNKYSSVVLAVEPYIEESKIPAICSGSNIKVEQAGNPYLFSTRRSDYGTGATMVAFIKTQNAKRVAILYAPDALGKGMSGVVRDNLKNTDIQIVSDQQYSEGEKQFATYIAKMKAANPDFIVCIGQSTESGLIIKAISDAGMGSIPCIGSSAYAQATTIEQAGIDAIEGLFSITPFSPALAEEPTASWVKEYKAKYGHDPEMTSVTTYDALSMICEAIKATGSDKPEDVKNGIMALKNFEGIAASYSYNGGAMLANSEVIIQIHNGKSQVLNKVVINN